MLAEVEKRLTGDFFGTVSSPDVKNCHEGMCCWATARGELPGGCTRLPVERVYQVQQVVR